MALTSIRILLGLYPKTEEIERKQNNLLSEYAEYKKYLESEELKHFFELEKVVTSAEFAERKNYFLTLNYQGSDEEQKEKEYQRLKKWHEIVFYYKFKASKEYAVFLEVEKSVELKKVEELKVFIESAEFKKVEQYMNDPKKWEQTDEHHKEVELKSMFANITFKNYFKFIADKSFSDFAALYKSADIEHFHEIEKQVQSADFETAKASMTKEEFSNSDASKKLHEYESIKKSARYKHYIKLLQSELIHDFKKLHNTPELEYYKELDTLVRSDMFKQKKKDIAALKFSTTPEFAKLTEYKKLMAQPSIKTFFNVKQSEKLAEFLTLDGGKMITDYEALEKTIISDEFKSQKTYLLDSKKWFKTDEYKQLSEYEALKKSDKLKWYTSCKNSGKFDKLNEWNLVFEEDFNSGKLDRTKWLTRYFWGEVLLHDTYALPGEKHLFTDGKNVEMNGTIAKIVTKSEKIEGKEWNPMLGFYPRNFDYTSGLLSTASSFRTKYGKIEAKVKFTGAEGVMHAFWLAGEAMLPQIDIFKTVGKKLYQSTFWGNIAEENGVKNNTTSISASKFTSDFFIYTIEWTPEKIEWRINNLVIKTQTEHIPDEPLYVVINSGVVSENVQGINSMEIDWVRCYQSN